MGLRLGARSFDDSELIVMAIINRTPDSFFDKGATFGLGAALARVDQAIAEGAGIIDVGGVKAGPGDIVDAEEELRRTADLVAGIRAAYPEIVISVDTWRADVADAVCGLGCDLINDAWGGTDPAIFAVAARHGVGMVCTHAGRLPPRTRPHRIAYDDVMADVLEVTTGLAERAVAAGVRPDGVLIDPGHDFGKNSRHSLQVTNRLGEMVTTGWPVLVSLSRKDFIGEMLDLPPDDRLEGTLAATAISAWLGARVFRAHDVAATRRTLDVVSAIRGDTDLRVARRGLA
ncbi:MAG: dihydropteroate synthase [Actinomycetota bacterium]